MSEQNRGSDETEKTKAPARVEEVKFPSDLDPKVQIELSKQAFVMAIIGYFLGGLVILAGVLLIVFGFAGDVEFSFSSGNTETHVSTAVVGVVIALLGAIVVVASRHKVTVVQAQASS